MNSQEAIYRWSLEARAQILEHLELLSEGRTFRFHTNGTKTDVTAELIAQEEARLRSLDDIIAKHERETGETS